MLFLCDQDGSQDILLVGSKQKFPYCLFSEETEAEGKSQYLD